jgi:hypothetical protein
MKSRPLVAKAATENNYQPDFVFSVLNDRRTLFQMEA